MTASCTTCDVLICSTCLTEATHRQHPVVTIEVASARVQAELTPLLVPRGVEDWRIARLDAAIDKITETRAALAAHLAKQLDSITAQEDATIMRVKEDATIMLVKEDATAKRDEITAAVGRTNAALLAQEAAVRQHGTLLRELNDYTHALLAMVKGSELVQVGSAIKERIEEARSFEVEDVRPVVVSERFPHFVQRSGRTTLGRIVEHPITPGTMGRKGTPNAIYVIGGRTTDGRKLRQKPSVPFRFDLRSPSVLRFDLRSHAWEHPATLRTRRSALTVTRIGSYVYAMGGWTRNQCSATMERLDITKPDAEWTTCAPLSTARRLLAATSMKGILYALGGENAEDELVTSVERYDPATDAWTACAPMRTALEGHAAVALNDHIYVLGGKMSRDHTAADVNRYNPATDTWTACAPMRTARHLFAAAAINGSIIVAGGFNADDMDNEPIATVRTVERYDAATNTWTACAPMPTARAAAGSCAVGTSLYVLGGLQTYNYKYILPIVERYDAYADRWEPCPPMPAPRCNMGAIAW